MEFKQVREGVFTVDDVLSASECDALMQATEAIGYGAAPITTAVGPIMAPDIRNNTRVMIDDRKRAAWLWPRLAPWIPKAEGTELVGLNERFRYYRYQPGQFFNWHHDGAFRRTLREWSTLTLMVYLNGDMVGGHTEFQGGVSVAPKSGMALVFDHGIRHRGAPVKTGTKYVLRTDVMVRR